MLAAALLAIPALASAATLTVTGTSSGTATAEPPDVDATCNPQAPTVASDFVCDFTIAGTFSLTELGTGTYTGATRLDWSIYTSAEPCAELTGSMTLTNAQGTLTLDIDSTSRVCETASPTQHTSSMDATAVSGTGAYAGASGTFTGTGTLDATATAGTYTAEQTLAGSVVIPDPTPTPTPTPTATPTATVAPTATATASPTPVADQLPDTSTPSTPTLPILGVLAAVFMGSALLRGYRARRGATRA